MHFPCRHLSSRYPWFPDVNALTVAVLSRTDVSDPSSPVYPLSQFVLQYPRLKMGIDLLPSIVELYQWLHTELTYAVTYDEAASITLGHLAKVAAKYLSYFSAASYEKLKGNNVSSSLLIQSISVVHFCSGIQCICSADRMYKLKTSMQSQ